MFKNAEELISFFESGLNSEVELKKAKLSNEYYVYNNEEEVKGPSDEGYVPSTKTRLKFAREWSRESNEYVGSDNEKSYYLMKKDFELVDKYCREYVDLYKKEIFSKVNIYSEIKNYIFSENFKNYFTSNIIPKKISDAFDIDLFNQELSIYGYNTKKRALSYFIEKPTSGGSSSGFRKEIGANSRDIFMTREDWFGSIEKDIELFKNKLGILENEVYDADSAFQTFGYKNKEEFSEYISFYYEKFKYRFNTNTFRNHAIHSTVSPWLFGGRTVFVGTNNGLGHSNEEFGSFGINFKTLKDSVDLFKRSKSMSIKLNHEDIKDTIYTNHDNLLKEKKSRGSVEEGIDILGGEGISSTLLFDANSDNEYIFDEEANNNKKISSKLIYDFVKDFILKGVTPYTSPPLGKEGEESHHYKVDDGWDPIKHSDYHSRFEFSKTLGAVPLIYSFSEKLFYSELKNRVIKIINKNSEKHIDDLISKIPDAYSSIKNSFNKESIQKVFLDICFRLDPHSMHRLSNSSILNVFQNIEHHNIYTSAEHFNNKVEESGSSRITDYSSSENADMMNIKRLFISNFQIYLMKLIREKIELEAHTSLNIKKEIINFDKIIKKSIEDFNEEEFLKLLSGSILYTKEEKDSKYGNIELSSEYYGTQNQNFLTKAIENSKKEEIKNIIFNKLIHKDNYDQVLSLQQEMSRQSSSLVYENNFYFENNIQDTNDFTDNYISSSDDASALIRRNIFRKRLDFYKKTGFRNLRNIPSSGVAPNLDGFFIKDEEYGLSKNIFFQKILNLLKNSNSYKIYRENISSEDIDETIKSDILKEINGHLNKSINAFISSYVKIISSVKKAEHKSLGGSSHSISIGEGPTAINTTIDYPVADYFAEYIVGQLNEASKTLLSKFSSKMSEDPRSLVMSAIKKDYGSLTITPIGINFEKNEWKVMIPEEYADDNFFKKIEEEIGGSEYIMNMKDYDENNLNQILLFDLDPASFITSGFSIISERDIGQEYINSINDGIIKIQRFDNMPDFYLPSGNSTSREMINRIVRVRGISLSDESRTRIKESSVAHVSYEEEAVANSLKMSSFFNSIEDEKIKLKIFKNIEIFNKNLKILLKDFINTEEKYLTSNNKSFYRMLKFPEYKSLFYSKNNINYLYDERLDNDESEKNPHHFYLKGLFRSMGSSDDSMLGFNGVISSTILEKISSLNINDYIYMFVFSSEKEYNNQRKIAKFLEDTFFRRSEEYKEFVSSCNANFSSRYQFFQSDKYFEIKTFLDFSIRLKGSKTEKMAKIINLQSAMHSEFPSSDALNYKFAYDLKDEDIDTFILGEEDIEYLKNSKYLNKYNINITQEAVGTYFSYLVAVKNSIQKSKPSYSTLSSGDIKDFAKNTKIKTIKSIASFAFSLFEKEEACLILGLKSSKLNVPFEIDNQPDPGESKVSVPFKTDLVCKDFDQLNDVDFYNIENKIFGSLEAFLSFINIDYSNLNSEKTVESLKILRKLKLVFSTFSKAGGIERFSEYIEGPKKKELYSFNFSFEINKEEDIIYKFETLKDLDPYHFQVGGDTNCCQILGSEGEGAAVDSFINEYAGVLLLRRNGSLMAQSYFHWLPEENYLILDNIERSANSYRVDFKIEDCYSILANHCIQNNLFNKVLCGMEFNKIDNELFGKNNENHSGRHFEWDRKYTDYNSDKSLDLSLYDFGVPTYTKISGDSEKQEEFSAVDLVKKFKNKFESFNKEYSGSKLLIEKLKKEKDEHQKKLQYYEKENFYNSRSIVEFQNYGISKESIKQFFINSIDKKIEEIDLKIEKEKESNLAKSEVKSKIILEIRKSNNKDFLIKIKDFLDLRKNEELALLMDLNDKKDYFEELIEESRLELEKKPRSYYRRRMREDKESLKDIVEKIALINESIIIYEEELYFIENIIKSSSLYPEDKIIKLCRYLLFNNKEEGLKLIKFAFSA